MLKQLLAATLLAAASIPEETLAQAPRAATTESAARAILAELIAANTTASTGSTTPIASKLASRFRAAGFPAADVMVIGASTKNRNLVVRWRGRTRAKPIVLNAHLDVVEAPRLDWSTDPFVLTEKDGYLYGRGVIDDKGPSAAVVAAMIALRRQGVVPERDIVLTLTAGEESDVDNGVRWLLAQRRDLVDAEYVLNLDSGGGSIENGIVQSFGVQSAEKIYFEMELVSRGPGGHSSMPSGLNPIERLARAIGKVSEVAFPVRVSPVVRMFMAREGQLRTGEVGAAMKALAAEPFDLAAQNRLLVEPQFNAVLRTTCIPTMLRGGTAPNAIPQEVAATINCRILPGETQDSVVAMLRRAIADTLVDFRVVVAATPSGPSLPGTQFLAMIERVAGVEFLGIPAVPYMETGATDALWFRNAGIPTFGVSGAFVPDEEFARLHGRDERISVSAFGAMVRYTERLLREIAR